MTGRDRVFVIALAGSGHGVADEDDLELGFYQRACERETGNGAR